MGCPEIHYREMLVSYVRMNVSFSKLSKKLTEENLFKLDTTDLEILAKSFNRSNPKYAAYMCGCAVANVINELSDCNDALNASAASICMIEELFNIKVPENVDYMSEQGKPILEKLENIKKDKDPID